MTKTLFGTFKKFINNPDGTRKIVLTNLSDDFGDEVSGYAHIDNAMVILCMNLKFGDRYMVKYGYMENFVLKDICQTKKVNKNRRCDIFRRFKDEFHIIGGKYKGKKDNEIDRLDLIKYCIWLGQKTYNEMTIKNVLTLLKKIHNDNNT